MIQKKFYLRDIKIKLEEYSNRKKTIVMLIHLKAYVFLILHCSPCKRHTGLSVV